MDNQNSNAGYQGQMPAIPNYLVHSILVTLFCCLPLGIAAIVFSAQVNSKLAAGDVQGATDSSDKARLFCWISLGLGLLWSIMWVIIVILGMLPAFFAH